LLSVLNHPHVDSPHGFMSSFISSLNIVVRPHGTKLWVTYPVSYSTIIQSNHVVTATVMRLSTPIYSYIGPCLSRCVRQGHISYNFAHKLSWSATSPHSKTQVCSKQGQISLVLTSCLGGVVGLCLLRLCKSRIWQCRFNEVSLASCLGPSTGF
jgi:hypothetical protein